MTEHKSVTDAYAAAENTLTVALYSTTAKTTGEYVRIAVDAARPYLKEAHRAEQADRLEAEALRVSVSAQHDPLALELDEALAGGGGPAQLAQVAYATIARLIRESRL